jgi:hypothetical protein
MVYGVVLLLELCPEPGEFIFVICPAVDGGGGFLVQQADLGLKIFDLRLRG